MFTSSTGRAHGLVNKYLLNLHMIVQTVEHKRDGHGQEQGEKKCASGIGRYVLGVGGKEGKTKDEMMGR